ncbi:MAG: hypothetical protein ACR2JY_15865 [Chloroflexota bacterium]
MRVLLVVGNRLVRQVLAEHLKAYGLTGQTVPLDEVLAADDGPAVLLWARSWHPRAAAIVHRLAERQAVPFVVCEESAFPKTHLAILQAGARAAATEDRDALEALVFQVARTVRERGVAQWQLGGRVFDVQGGCLFADGERIALSSVEAHMLRRLCESSADDSANRLTARALTAELPTEGKSPASQEASVRNYITKLRRLVEDDPEHPQVLLRDGGGYHIVLGAPAASAG